MTENEKRAHEFALSILPKLLDMRINEATKAGESDVDVDLYTEYLTAYRRVLNSFNRDFPDGK